jgi:hypothetical protein
VSPSDTARTTPNMMNLSFFAEALPVQICWIIRASDTMAPDLAKVGVASSSLVSRSNTHVYRVPWKAVELWANSEETGLSSFFSSSEFHWEPSEAGHS